MNRFLTIASMWFGITTGSVAWGNAPGTADGNFGSMGKGRETVSFAPESGYAAASALAPDGSIYLAGMLVLPNDQIDPVVARLTSNGVFDEGYGAVSFSVPGYPRAGFYDLVVQTDGKLIAVGRAIAGDSSRWLVCRLMQDGGLDTGFGDAQTPGCSTPLQGDAQAVGLQSDGRIVVAGQDNVGNPSRAALMRLETDGSLDASFADGGTLALLPEELTALSDFRELVVTSDDGITAAGGYGYKGNDQFMVAKFTPDGDAETGFSQDGVRLIDYTLLPPGERLNIVSGLAALADGSVIVSGTVYVPVTGGSAARIGVVKIEQDGDLSPDFVSQDLPDGQLLLDVCTQKCQLYSDDMAVLSDGRIVLAGGGAFGDPEVASQIAIRLMPDGKPDPEFIGNNDGEFAPGVALVDWDKFELSAMLLQGDRIVLTGHVPSPQMTNEFAAVRLLGDRVFGDGLESD